MDMNGHMRHTGYLDYSAKLRVDFFMKEVFGLENFKKLGIGPILLREFIEYKREIHLEDRFKMDMQLLGMSTDGAHWRLRHNVYKLSNMKLSCSIVVEGAWIMIKERKMCIPPAEIVTGFCALKKTRDFKTLDHRSRVKLEY